MDNLNIDNNPQQNKRSNRLSLFLRWLVGGVIGFVSGLLLLGISFALGPTLLGFIFVGQYLIFEQFFFFIFWSLYREAISNGLDFLTSVLVYSIVWGIIGALLGSGRKKQVIIGIVIVIIYVAVGLLGLQLYGSTMFPT
jgi:hypothetical protein